MKSRVVTSFIVTLALASSAAAKDLSPAERAALAAPPAHGLVELRAGASDPVPPVAQAERLMLTQAQASSQDLDALRAGDISDHDLVIVAIIVGIIALIIAL